MSAGLQARAPGATAAIRNFVAQTGCPALTTYKAKGVVSERESLGLGVYAGGVAEEALIGSADIILLVGFDPVEGKPVLDDPDLPSKGEDERAAWERLAPIPVLHREFSDLMTGPSDRWSLEKSSFLLFGPPGTSKSTLARSLAQCLGWHFVELTPSNFVEQGLEMIESRSREIFDDLAMLREAVVLFDELDEGVEAEDGWHGR